jgi:hypothetical protein
VLVVGRIGQIVLLHGGVRRPELNRLAPAGSAEPVQHDDPFVVVGHGLKDLLELFVAGRLHALARRRRRPTLDRAGVTFDEFVLDGRLQNRLQEVVRPSPLAL